MNIDKMRTLAGARLPVPGKDVAELIDAYDVLASDISRLIDMSIPKLSGGGRYFAIAHNGQWHYINHGGTWQGMPDLVAEARKRALTEAAARLTKSGKAFSSDIVLSMIGEGMDHG